MPKSSISLVIRAVDYIELERSGFESQLGFQVLLCYIHMYLMHKLLHSPLFSAFSAASILAFFTLRTCRRETYNHGSINNIYMQSFIKGRRRERGRERGRGRGRERGRGRGRGGVNFRGTRSKILYFHTKKLKHFHIMLY